MKKWIPAIVSGLLVVAILGLIVATRSSNTPVTAIPMKSAPALAVSVNADEFVQKLNDYRESKGLGRLVVNTDLTVTSTTHAQDEHNRAYYSHDTPEGVTAYTRIRAVLGSNARAGEIEDELCGATNAQQELDRFIQSKEHNDTILDSQITLIGIGVVQASDYQVCDGRLVVDFGTLPPPPVPAREQTCVVQPGLNQLYCY